MDPLTLLGVFPQFVPFLHTRLTAPKPEIEWRRIPSVDGARLSCLAFNGRSASFRTSKAGMRRQPIAQVAIDGRIVLEGAEAGGQTRARFPIHDELRNNLVPSNLTWQTDVLPGFIPREVVVVNYVSKLNLVHNLGTNCPIEPGVYYAELYLLVDNVRYETKARFAIIPETRLRLWLLGYTPLERSPIPGTWGTTSCLFTETALVGLCKGILCCGTCRPGCAGYVTQSPPCPAIVPPPIPHHLLIIDHRRIPLFLSLPASGVPRKPFPSQDVCSLAPMRVE